MLPERKHSNLGDNVHGAVTLGLVDIALFAASGRIGRDVDDLFRDASWVQVMLGQGIMPADYDPMADQIAPAQLAEFLANLRTLIARGVASLPTHEDYLRQHCPADASLLAA